MLISFTLKNWKSFRDGVTFSAAATKERQHGERVAHVASFNKRILPVSAIYGGNASGKSNFCDALIFAKGFVSTGFGLPPEVPVPATPFALDEKSIREPSCFSFVLLIGSDVYGYDFEITNGVVTHETLTEYRRTVSKTLFDYTRSQDDKIAEGGPVSENLHLSDEEFTRLQFVFKGTRWNQLFLTNSMLQSFDIFKQVYSWFANDLVVISPNTQFEAIEQYINGTPLHEAINRVLPELDTGISRLDEEEVSMDDLPLPAEFKEQKEKIQNARIRDAISGNRYAVTRENGKLVARKIVTFHQCADGSEKQFEIRNEADGSKRVIDILPAFFDIANADSERVYVFDEIDRSLHTLLTEGLLTAYLNSCNHDTRSQLIFTTHDVMLMDQNLLRRDEMWLFERGQYGGTSLFSISDYQGVRYDKDIQKSYLEGRFGGIPRIFLSDFKVDAPSLEEGKR